MVKSLNNTSTSKLKSEKKKDSLLYVNLEKPHINKKALLEYYCNNSHFYKNKVYYFSRLLNIYLGPTKDIYM